MNEQGTQRKELKNNVLKRVLFELNNSTDMGLLIGPKGSNIRSLEEKFINCTITTGKGDLDGVVEISR